MPVTIPERRQNKSGAQPKAPLRQRLLWFAAFYLVGLGTVAIVAFGLRLWIKS